MNYLPPCARVADIKVGKRHRKDLGDIRALADSIEELGVLIQPIPVTPDYQLIAGARRLEAVKLLGWETVPVHVIGDLEEAIKFLKAERDENTCRLDFAPSEAVSLGKELEEWERAQAEERKKAGQSKGGKKGQDKSSENDTRHDECKNPSARDNSNKTSSKVGGAVGMSGKTYEKAKAVVEAAEAEPDRFGPIVDKMDTRRNVDAAYQEMKAELAEAERAKRAAAFAEKNGPTNIVQHADFRDVAKSIDDGAVSLIFTDPPYDRPNVPIYGDLAEVASRVLRPGGSLICYCGHYILPEIIELLSKHLDFYWCCACVHSGPKAKMREYGITVGWKPLLWFTNGKRPPHEKQHFVNDTVSGGREKDNHAWQQAQSEAAYYIENLTRQGEVIFEPFAGGGTTVAAGLSLGRKVIAAEIDLEKCQLAEELALKAGIKAESA